MKNRQPAGEVDPRRPLLEILVALSGGEASAAGLLATLEEWPGGRALPLGSLYRHLDRGVAEGWIEIEDCPSGVGRGRPARLYRLTAAGREVASVALARLDRLTALARTAGFLSGEAP